MGMFYPNDTKTQIQFYNPGVYLLFSSFPATMYMLWEAANDGKICLNLSMACLS